MHEPELMNCKVCLKCEEWFNLQCYLYPTCLGVVQNHQHGVIGMTVDSGWYEPLRNNSVDREASNRAMEFELGWWVFSSRSLDSFSVSGYASCFRELQLHSYTSIYTLIKLFQGFSLWCHCCRFLDPIFFGEYPNSMQLGLGTRLPRFTAEEKERIKGSYDFVGFNHYTSQYATVDISSASNDNHVTFTRKCNPHSYSMSSGLDSY